MISTIKQLKFLGRKLKKEDIPEISGDALYYIGMKMINRYLPISWDDLPDINSLWDYIDEEGGMSYDNFTSSLKDAARDRLEETGIDLDMFESMTRKHNWDQLEIIQSKIDKQGGDISKQLGSDYKRQSKTANSYWINNPLKKKIALSDDEPNTNSHSDPQLKNLPKNSLIRFENFKVNENETISLDKLIKLADKAGEYVLDLKDDLMDLGMIGNNIPLDRVINILHRYDLEIEDLNESFKEKGEEIRVDKEDRGNVNKITREMKTVRNWNNYFTDNIGGNPDPIKPRNILIGKQVIYGDNKEGYIEEVIGDKVIVQTLDNTGHDIVKFSEITKNYEIKKQDKVEDISLQGPNQSTESSEIKEDIKKVKNIENKAVADKKTKKIAKEIYKGKDLKLKNLQSFGTTKF